MAFAACVMIMMLCRSHPELSGTLPAPLRAVTDGEGAEGDGAEGRGVTEPRWGVPFREEGPLGCGLIGLLTRP